MDTKKRLDTILKFFFVIFLILISGCKSKTDSKTSLEDIRTGTQGIVMSFVQNAPPDKIRVEDYSDDSLDIILELRNKGAYPQPGEGEGNGRSLWGGVILSGYDPNILYFGDGTNDLNWQTFEKKALEGKSIINTNGGLDLVTFKGRIASTALNVEKYEPILLATACYKYKTTAGSSVCIDPNPYSTVNQRKVCQVSGVSMSNQGAPIAVTRIDEEAFSGRTQFKITIKNVGGGDVFISDDSKEKCIILEREDIDKIVVTGVSVGNDLLDCRPFLNSETTFGKSGITRLINGEGFIICEYSSYKNKGIDTAYISPMTINLEYKYRNSVQKKIEIRKDIVNAKVTEHDLLPPS